MNRGIAMKNQLGYFVLSLCIVLSACSEKSVAPVTSTAPGAPGATSHWSYAGKTGIGTSYEQYTNGRYEDGGASGKISKVWFSLAQGIITETMFGLIHEAQLQEVQFYIKGKDFLHQEKTNTISTIEYLDKDGRGRPLSLAYKIINKDKAGKYEIEKHIFTDPDTNSLVVKVYFRSFSDDITPYLYINPNIANSGTGDRAGVKMMPGVKVIYGLLRMVIRISPLKPMQKLSKAQLVLKAHQMA